MVGGKSDRYLLLIKGANHFSIANPVDPTIGTSFLDFVATQPDEQSRNLIAGAIGLFIDAHVRDRSDDIIALEQLLRSEDRAIASFERKLLTRSPVRSNRHVADRTSHTSIEKMSSSIAEIVLD